MSKLVTGIYDSRAAANEAVDHLVRKGFSPADISVVMTETTRGREFGVKESSKAPEGAAAGAAVGGTLGAIIAGLAAVGVIVIPGVGLVAAGPILAALAGAGAGAIAGGAVGAGVGASMPEHELKLYSDELQRGGILVGVYAADDRVDMAKDCLRLAGGEHITAAA
jgi:hypothetical protein